MKRAELTRKLARRTHQSTAQAKDEIDTLVHRILSALRKGQPLTLPAVGRLSVQKPNSKARP